ncbi:MAG: YidC/Oxa1 family membrane protein insertase [Termitinemataceae bacterium]|nr:MAG: YidC/Oxa1 family membrane protein insertase [Termitinemataceae bacterium]
MLNILYTIIIYPITLIIEYSFMIVHRIFDNTVLSLIGVSVAVTLSTLPLYFIAEKHQETERNIQKRLALQIAKIKAVFSGDEQYMILSACYRQNHYHPVFALRNTFSLLIQIPFFIAAYSYISHLDMLRGVSFFMLRDLSVQDELLHIGTVGINVMPIIMTVINCISGTIYTRGFLLKDKIQVYLIAAVFFVLLYNSPAGLVFYWTMNNMFSLLKNILLKTKHAKSIIYAVFSLCVIALYAYTLSRRMSAARIFLPVLCTIILFIPLLTRFIKKKMPSGSVLNNSNFVVPTQIFILSSFILFILAGLVVPCSLIASSVQEFSFVDSYESSPLLFIRLTLLQSAGIFLFWPICVYYLFDKKRRSNIALVFTFIAIIALVDIFIFPGNYGFLTTTFRFSDAITFESQSKQIIVNSIILLAIIITPFLFVIKQVSKNILYSFQIILCIALITFSLINVNKINNEFDTYKQRQLVEGDVQNKNTVYTFSKTGKNVLVIMLDACNSLYIPYLFEEKPQLLSQLSGFTYYPNCVAFGNHTKVGAPALWGGYEYVPTQIQKARNKTMAKHNEALLMLPKLFLDNDYSVTVTDPPFANYSWKPDLSIFKDYPQIDAKNIISRYTNQYLNEHSEIEIVSLNNILRTHLIRYAFFKMSPAVFRMFIYDKADWLIATSYSESNLTLDTIDNYAALANLQNITSITADKKNIYIAMDNDLTHYPAFLKFPEYIPSVNIDNANLGSGPFANEATYHVTVASFLLLGKWFQYLKENGVYDNTRIIIASDHGRDMNSKIEKNIQISNGDFLSDYNATLLVKDFKSTHSNETSELVTDDTFMTHADVPFIASFGLIPNPVNPFTNKALKTDEKHDGAVVTSGRAMQHKIRNDQWMHVSDNIFDASNWKNILKSPLHTYVIEGK